MIDVSAPPQPARAAPPAGPDEAVPWRDEVRTATMVCQRELIRFLRARTRLLSGLVQPVLFLFVLGFGLSPLVGSAGGLDFKEFVLPGVVAMSVVTTAIFSGVSIVWDREFGFLREMLVAPPGRAALVAGKTAGGAVVASVQGTIMLVFAPLVGIRLAPMLVVEVVAAELLMAVALTAFGVFIASRIEKIESFQVVMQLLLLPMLFLSGAMFPLHDLPGWLAVLTRLNPLTYAVDPLRQIVFAAQHVPAAALARFPTGVELFGYRLPIGLELAFVGAFALVFLAAAIRGFGKPE